MQYQASFQKEKGRKGTLWIVTGAGTLHFTSLTLMGTDRSRQGNKRTLKCIYFPEFKYITLVRTIIMQLPILCASKGGIPINSMIRKSYLLACRNSFPKNAMHIFCSSEILLRLLKIDYPLLSFFIKSVKEKQQSTTGR